MIVSICCALIAMRQEPETATTARPATAAKLLSQVFQHYSDARSLGGHIRFSQSAQNVTIHINSDVAFDLPSQLLIRQAKDGSEPRNVLIVSDGEKFSYDKPAGTFGPDRFVEYVHQLAGSQEVKEMYGTSAITLEDRVITDIVFARTVDLQEARSHWSSLHYGPKVTIRGIEANSVEGDYLEVAGQPSAGTFAMAITNAGDILQYTVKNRYAVPNQVSQSILVTSVWDIDLTVNAKNDPKIYLAR